MKTTHSTIIPAPALARAHSPSSGSWRRRSRAMALALFAVLHLAGCAVNFLSTYDSVTDQAVQQAATKAEVIFADAVANQTGYAAHRENYREARGALSAVALRASMYGDKNKPEQELVANAQQSFAQTEKSHRLIGSLRSAEVQGARTALQALIHHQLSKKKSAAILKKDVTP